MSCFGWEGKDLEQIIEIAAMVTGGFDKLQQKPFLALYSEPSSPLIHSREALDKAIFCGKRRLPVIYTPCVMAGATGPVTMAGTIALGIAENLVGLVATQLLNRMRYVNWQEKAGGADLEKKTKERTREILEEHEVEPKPEEVQESIEEIIVKAEERVAQQNNK